MVHFCQGAKIATDYKEEGKSELPESEKPNNYHGDFK